MASFWPTLKPDVLVTGTLVEPAGTRDRAVGQRLPQRCADVPGADDGRVVAVARRVQRGFTGVLVELVRGDVARTGLPAGQRGDVGGGQRVVVDLEVVHGGRQERVAAELRTADPVLVGGAQGGGVRVMLVLVATGWPFTYSVPVLPDSVTATCDQVFSGSVPGAVELLLRTIAAGGDGEAERAAAGAER